MDTKSHRICYSNIQFDAHRNRYTNRMAFFECGDHLDGIAK
jgi:hypothetical protein